MKKGQEIFEIEKCKMSDASIINAIDESGGKVSISSIVLKTGLPIDTVKRGKIIQRMSGI